LVGILLYFRDVVMKVGSHLVFIPFVVDEIQGIISPYESLF